MALALGVALGCGLAPARADQPAKPAVATASPAPPPRPSAPLTIKDFLEDATWSKPRLSPDGKHLAIVHRRDDVDQVYLLTLPDMKPVSLYQTRRVPAEAAKKHFREYVSYLGWKTNDTLLVSIAEPVRFTIYDYTEVLEAPVHLILKTDLQAPPLFINEKVRGGSGKVELSWIADTLKSDPDHVLMVFRPGLENQDLVRVDIRDGKRETLESGGTDMEWGADKKGNGVTRTISRGNGAFTLEGRPPGERKWTKIFDYRQKEQRELEKYEFLGLGEVGKVYVAAYPDNPSEGDTKAVRAFDLKTMTMGPKLWANEKYDADGIIQDEDTGAFIAGCYWADTYQCEFNTPKLAAHMKGINKYFENKRNAFIVSQSDDDTQWVLSVNGPDEPTSYYLYDVTAHDLKPLGERWPALSPDRLGEMSVFNFKSRDGAALSAYVTMPPTPCAPRCALVVMPHGGPESRDYYAFDLWSQYLATRGYMVLQPTFRGSGGYGRKFAEAGYGEWGGRMHDDVMDATRALIAEGKVDPGRVCMVGASYGGYEAMYTAATEPGTFRCAVAVAGLSDMVGNMRWQKSFGRDSARYTYWLKSQGDPDKDSARMLAHSPYRVADKVQTPLMLIHGTKDTIVPPEESRQMKRAMEGAGKSVTYLEVEGMGHGPSTDEENTKVLTAIGDFLAPYLNAPKGPTAATSSGR